MNGSKIYNVGQYVVNEVPQEYQELIKEIMQNHPDLFAVLEAKKGRVEEQLEEIATYLNVLIEGKYRFQTSVTSCM